MSYERTYYRNEGRTPPNIHITYGRNIQEHTGRELEGRKGGTSLPDIRMTIAAPAFSNNVGFEMSNLYTPARSQDKRLRSHNSLRSPLNDDKSSSPGKAKNEPRVVAPPFALILKVMAAAALLACMDISRRCNSTSSSRSLVELYGFE